jgi:hypothetical protein
MFRSVTRLWVAKLDWPKKEARTGLPFACAPRGAVWSRAGERHRELVVAVRGAAQPALLAPAAVVRREQHPVPRLDLGDGWAGAFDDPGALMTEDDREHDGEAAQPGVVVGVADADGLDPDEDLVIARLVEVKLLDRQRRARLPGDGGLDLHAFSLRASFWGRAGPRGRSGWSWS